jgi:hypothetical protein
MGDWSKDGMIVDAAALEELCPKGSEGSSKGLKIGFFPDEAALQMVFHLLAAKSKVVVLAGIENRASGQELSRAMEKVFPMNSFLL